MWKTDNWREIDGSELPQWNRHLLRTSASFLQFPYWNEPYRSLHFKPVYLVWGDAQSSLAYVCILTLQAGLRIGLVQRGPVELAPGALTDEAVSSLCEWAKSHHYGFLLFRHSDGDLMAHLATIAPAQRFDSFPLLPVYGAEPFELVIDQKNDDRTMLAGFHREARRQIRRAIDEGYVVRSSHTPEEFAAAWPLFVTCSKRKRFAMKGSLESYLKKIRLAGPHGCTSTYTVFSNGQAIGAALVMRDRDTAVALLAAAELRKPSCSALMHWVAMRDMFHAGVRYYSLGPASPPFGRFKDRFSPRRVLCPPSVTVEIAPRFCRIWQMAFPVLVAITPGLRWMAHTAAARQLFRVERATEPVEFTKPASD
jgi:lipid II:glycine glycyltransferase (peptidoglycan interpeptide bridge formation enzyme)